jgi:hypothetical protein
VRLRYWIGGLALAGVLACGEKKPEQQGAMPGMGGTAGMQAMMMKSDSLMPAMRAHLDSVGGMPGTSLPGMLASHDAVTSQMLDAMGSDMAMMSMQPDSTWAALADSVRRDLADLPSLSGQALTTRVQAHIGRVRRLLDMHATMMQR